MKKLLLSSIFTLAVIAALLLAFYIGMGRELCTYDLTQAEKDSMRLTCD